MCSIEACCSGKKATRRELVGNIKIGCVMNSCTSLVKCWFLLSKADRLQLQPTLQETQSNPYIWTTDNTLRSSLKLSLVWKCRWHLGPRTRVILIQESWTLASNQECDYNHSSLSSTGDEWLSLSVINVRNRRMVFACQPCGQCAVLQLFYLLHDGITSYPWQDNNPQPVIECTQL